ncbi:hypothetical protein [Paludibaculum fermentans]|uniref:Transmembrane protein n=1 Tax=Paludibaculum fermentans TaxID=1473598 RepID=A0A7S7SNQ6_PALFE|nr:hypothetical protein [Paludibaculum fermentans]QOY91163.1 hypothetical protein IRI77_14805 [Paludibaculum fermentans]
MRTLLIIGGGFLLLAICLLVARVVGGSSGLAKGVWVYVPLWLACAAANMWMGVAKAGYSVREELPIFLLIFAIPAAAALLVVYRVGPSR